MGTGPGDSDHNRVGRGGQKIGGNEGKSALFWELQDA